MKSVYVITRSQYKEDGNDQCVMAIHETLEGAREHFKTIVEEEKSLYMYSESDSTDTSREALEEMGVEENWHEDASDGTLNYHIWRPDGWNELYIDMWIYPVLA